MTDRINYQVPKRSYDMGRVFNRAFGTFSTRFVPLAVFGLILTLLPQVLILIAAFVIAGTSAVGLSSNIMAGGSIFLIFVILGIYLLQAVLLPNTVAVFARDNARNSSAKISDSFRYTFFLVLPLIGQAILIAICFMIGYLFIIIPGIIILVGWYLASPCLLFERTGAFESLGRAWTITKGMKWWIFLLFIILGIFFIILFSIQMGLMIALMGGGQAEPSIAATIGSLLIGALTGWIMPVLSGLFLYSVYTEAKYIEQGVTDDMSEVFD